MSNVNLGPFQKQSCYSCCYSLSKQDILGFCSSQQPGPPTQTVYLRLGLDLCVTASSPLTPPTPRLGHVLAVPLCSFTRVTQILFGSICFNGFGLLFWEPACLPLTESRPRLCLRFVSGFSQKHLQSLKCTLCCAGAHQSCIL